MEHKIYYMYKQCSDEATEKQGSDQNTFWQSEKDHDAAITAGCEVPVILLM